MIFNAKKASSLKPEKTDKGVRLTDKFTRLLWIAQGEPLPALTGTASTPLTASFTAQREMFRRITAPLRSPTTSRSRGSTLRREPLVRAEIDGGSEDVVYAAPSSTTARKASRSSGRANRNDPELRKYLYQTHALRSARSAGSTRSSQCLASS